MMITKWFSACGSGFWTMPGRRGRRGRGEGVGAGFFLNLSNSPMGSGGGRGEGCVGEVVESESEPADHR